MPRQRKKLTSIIGVMVGFLLVFGLFLLSVSDIPFSSKISIVIWTIVVVYFTALFVWFIRTMYKPAMYKPKMTLESNKTSSENKQSLISSADAFFEMETTYVEWSLDLIEQTEWRAFKALCVGLWREKGFEVEKTSTVEDGGIDFYLCVSKARIGAIQCKNYESKEIGIKAVKELQDVIDSNDLKLGVLMYSNAVSKEAQEYINKPSVFVKLIGSKEIYHQIRKLSEVKKDKLLSEILNSDFT